MTKTIKISQDVMCVLEAATVSGNSLQLNGQLDRKLYEATNKVLVSIGAKWNRSAKAHLFEDDALETIEPILLTGEYSRTKQDFGQFDSPASVVFRVIKLAMIEEGARVLEPSAGIGRLAIAASEAGGDVTAYEIDLKRCGVLTEIYNKGTWPFSMVMNSDFLTLLPKPIYDRVVMNPPFAGQADISHVLHAYKFLKPGGLLVSVMSASVLYRSNKLTQSFREFVESNGGTFERLPETSFAESGTNVQTCIVTIPTQS